MPPVANATTGCTTGYVSWNGATDVEGWKVSAGDSAGKLVGVGEVRYAGFETGFVVGGRCVQVSAVVSGREQRGGGRMLCVFSEGGVARWALLSSHADGLGMGLFEESCKCVLICMVGLS